MLSWEIESYSVLTPNQGRLTILDNVKGIAHPGRLLAVMGASGSGKTTMLDVLCSRLPQSKDLKCKIKLGQTHMTTTDFSYVAQQDTLLNTATVGETLLTAIHLRNRDIDPKMAHDRVKSVLKDLGLTEKENSYVGGGEVRALSGGERRRTSIAQEIASSNCPVICCDEPTTGLDSNTAEHVVSCLKTIALNKKMIVIATIHQPNSTIASMFDDLMLLHKGKVLYMGPFDQAVQEFGKCGYICPLYVNPCDYFISSVAQTVGAAEKLEIAQNHRWQEQCLPVVLTTLAPLNQDTPPAKHDRVPFLQQVNILTVRAFRQVFRDPGIFLSELIQYLFVGLFIGGMYHNLNNNVQTGVFDRCSSMFFILAILVFTPPYTSLTTFNLERPLFKKERKDNLYNVTCWLGAKTLTVWPMEIALCMVFSCIVYFLVGFQRDAAKFFKFLLILILFQLFGESLGLCFSVGNDSVVFAIVWLSLVLIVALSLTGFLTSSMPSYYLWIQDSNIFRFALLALLVNEFEGLELTDTAGNVVARGIEALPPGLQPEYSFETYVGIIIAFVVGFRILIALQLTFIDLNYTQLLLLPFKWFMCSENKQNIEVPGDEKRKSDLVSEAI